MVSTRSETDFSNDPVSDYFFDSGNTVLYGDMAKPGVNVHYYHRTLEEFISVFRNNGLLLRTLRDVQPTQKMRAENHPQAKWIRMPFLMVLEFMKP